MIEQKKDSLGNPPYWVCLECNWAFQALQEANKHRCGIDKNLGNGFISYTRKIEKDSNNGTENR